MFAYASSRSYPPRPQNSHIPHAEKKGAAPCRSITWPKPKKVCPADLEARTLTSRRLVELAAQELGWKSTTTYTVLRRLCDRGLFQNEKSQVTSLVSREEFCRQQSRSFVQEAFGGSLPSFHGVYGRAQAHAGPGGGAAEPD